MMLVCSLLLYDGLQFFDEIEKIIWIPLTTIPAFNLKITLPEQIFQ